MYRCKYFTLKELVSPAVYNHFGEFAWNFLHEGMLKDLDIIRGDIWGKPLLINTWAFGGQFKESGFRCNTDSIVRSKKTPYCSGHVLGRAYDLKPENIDDLPKLYQALQLNYHKLKTISRMESIVSAPTWIHVDDLEQRGNCIKIFKV